MKKLQVRKIRKSDWDFLPDWWKDYPAWKDRSMPKEMLPGLFEPKGDTDENENSSLGLGGFMVCKGEDPIAAAWLYVTNSKMCFIAPVVSDKFYRDTDREEAFKMLLHFTTEFAYDMGFEYAYAWSNHDNLTNIYEHIGYKSAPCTELVIKL